jgi:hypothetical protein
VRTKGKTAMPMNSAQLAELVIRARHKAPPVTSTTIGATASRAGPSGSAGTASTVNRTAAAQAADAAGSVGCTSPLPSPAPQLKPEPTAEGDNFPLGWELRKESWHFHRRFYAVLRRPMAHGEYSHLLWQIRRRRARHLGEDCWRVTLPGSNRTLPVRATQWRLITILPKDWQPPEVRTGWQT